jgi:hypothetical protein
VEDFLIGTSWRPTGLTAARVSVVPENYGGVGSLIETNITPTLVPPKYTEGDPYIPQWNSLRPIVWTEQIIHPDELAALEQLQLIQVPGQDPAYWSPPGSASVGGS